MSRPHLAPEAAREIGREVARARARGVTWKVLEAVYNRTERQLRRYVDEVETGDPASVAAKETATV